MRSIKWFLVTTKPLIDLLGWFCADTTLVMRRRFAKKQIVAPADGNGQSTAEISAMAPPNHDPVAEWIETGRRLKKSLVDEHAGLLIRLKEVEDLLVRLSAADAGVVTPVVNAARIDLSKMTIQQAIVLAVGSKPDGASLPYIRDWLAREGKRVDPKHLASYIYKLRKDNVLKSRGAKGSMIYFDSLAKEQQEATT